MIFLPKKLLPFLKPKTLLFGFIVFLMNDSISAQPIRLLGESEIEICEGGNFMIKMDTLSRASYRSGVWQLRNVATGDIYRDIIVINDLNFSYSDSHPAIFQLWGSNIQPNYNNTFFRLKLTTENGNRFFSPEVLVKIREASQVPLQTLKLFQMIPPVAEHPSL